MEGQEGQDVQVTTGGVSWPAQTTPKSVKAAVCIIKQSAKPSRLPQAPGAAGKSPILTKSPAPKPGHAAYSPSPTRSDSANKTAQVPSSKVRTDAQSRPVVKRAVGQVKASPQQDWQPKPPDGKPRPVVPNLNLGKLLIPSNTAAGALASAGSNAPSTHGTGHRYADHAQASGSRHGQRHEQHGLPLASPAMAPHSPTRPRAAQINRNVAARTSSHNPVGREAASDRSAPRTAERTAAAAMRASKPTGYAAAHSPAKPAYAGAPSPGKCMSPVSNKHGPVQTNSPSPTATRSKSRLRCSLEVMPSARMVEVEEPVRRSGSVERSKVVPAVQHRETRASILRRSSSVDRRQSMSHAHAPAPAKRATPAANPTHQGYASIMRPTPPAESRDTHHTAARLRTMASPGAGPAGTAAARATAAAARAGAQGLLRRTSDSGVLSKLGGKTSGAVGRSHAGTAAAAAAEQTAAAAHKPAIGKMASSILAAIPERLKLQSTSTSNLAPALNKAMAAAGPPKLRLNLAAVKRMPEPDVNTVTSDPRSSSERPMPAVPKLNLTPVMEQQAAEQDVGDQYSMTPEELASIKTSQMSLPKKSSGKSVKKGGGGPPSPPPDHFYFYPKLDPDSERRTLDLLARMPKTEQKHWRKIFNDSIQAKQNCEAIAFRGHRLLDQMNSHHKEREQQVNSQLQEYKDMYEEAKQYKDMYQMLVGMLNPDQMMALQLQSLKMGSLRESQVMDQMSSGSGSNMPSPGPVFHTPQPDFQVPLFEVPSEANAVPMMRMSSREGSSTGAAPGVSLFTQSGKRAEMHSTHTFGTQPMENNPASVRITSDTYQLARDNIQAAVASTSIGGWAPAGRLADIEVATLVVEGAGDQSPGGDLDDAQEAVARGRDQAVSVHGLMEQLAKERLGAYRDQSRDVQPELDIMQRY